MLHTEKLKDVFNSDIESNPRFCNFGSSLLRYPTMQSDAFLIFTCRRHKLLPEAGIGVFRYSWAAIFNFCEIANIRLKTFLNAIEYFTGV